MTRPDPEALDRAQREMEAQFGELFKDGEDRGLEQLLAAGGPGPDGLAEAQADPQRVFGRYVLLQPVGRGGMATVWKAWDRDLGRLVAVKVLQDSGSAEHRQRFLREVSATAVLRHPNLVTVYDAGECRDQLFLVMELIEGRPLDVRQPLEALVGLLAKVAKGLEVAHGRGIVHRDIKPGNIMVDAAGEPHVVDFGLAHLVGDHLRITKTGAAIGTPVYMAPEQVAGRGGDIGPATDVYALGVMLYEALAGRPPFMGESATEIYGRILSDDPALPRSLNAGAPRDLETVALRAIEKEPGRRYANAGEFADDLRRYLAGEPVQARRPRLFHRWRRWIGRRKAVVAVAAAAVVAIGAVSLAFALGIRETKRTLALWSEISQLLARAEEFERHGEVAAARQRLDQGIDICRRHLEGSDFAHGRYFLGRFLNARGRRGEAEAELTRALAMDPQLGEAGLERGLLRAELYASRLVRAQIDAQLEEIGLAIARVPAAAELEDADPGLRRLREEASADLAAPRGKSSYFREEDALYGRGRLAMLNGDFPGAEQLFRSVLEMDPLQARACWALALIAGARQDHEEMARHATAAIDRNEGIVGPYVARSLAFDMMARRGDPAAAPGLVRKSLDDANRAVALAERDADALMYRAIIRRGAGDLAGAEEDCGRAIDIEGETPSNLLQRAVVYAEGRRLEEALADATRAIGLNSRIGALWINRGIVRFRMGDGAAAAADMMKAIELRRENVGAWNNLGLVRLESGDAAGAVDAFSEGLKHGPRYSRLHHNRANALKKLGDWNGALDGYTRAIDCDPRSAETLVARGNLFWLQLRDPEKALQDFSAAAAASPGYYKAHVNLGSLRDQRRAAFEARGMHSEAGIERAAAIAAYETALRIGIPDPGQRAGTERALKALKSDR